MSVERVDKSISEKDILDKAATDFMCEIFDVGFEGRDPENLNARNESLNLMVFRESGKVTVVFQRDHNFPLEATLVVEADDESGDPIVRNDVRVLDEESPYSPLFWSVDWEGVVSDDSVNRVVADIRDPHQPYDTISTPQRITDRPELVAACCGVVAVGLRHKAYIKNREVEDIFFPGAVVVNTPNRTCGAVVVFKNISPDTLKDMRDEKKRLNLERQSEGLESKNRRARLGEPGYVRPLVIKKGR